MPTVPDIRVIGQDQQLSLFLRTLIREDIKGRVQQLSTAGEPIF
jgi:hypothetical protein